MHSPDRLWWWTGQQWVPAVSPDRRWWWNASGWVPLPPPQFRYEPTVHTRRVQVGLLAVEALRILFGVLVVFVLLTFMDRALNTTISSSIAQSRRPPDPAQIARFRQFIRGVVIFAG